MPGIPTGKGASPVETIDWKDGEYNASHHASDVGVKIRHAFNRRKRIWEGYQVWTGRTTGWWQWDLILGEYQTLGAAQHAVESYLRLRGG
jgi:hypothetical protein